MMQKMISLCVAVLFLTGCAAIVRDVKYQIKADQCKSPWVSGTNCVVTIEKYFDLCPYKQGCGEYVTAEPAPPIEDL